MTNPRFKRVHLLSRDLWSRHNSWSRAVVESSKKKLVHRLNTESDINGNIKYKYLKKKKFSKMRECIKFRHWILLQQLLNRKKLRNPHSQ